MSALAAARERKAGLLVAAKRDRIARDVVFAAMFEQLARDAGARLVTADGVAPVAFDKEVDQPLEGVLLLDR